MKKEKSMKPAESKKSSTIVPIGDLQVTQPRQQRAEQQLPAVPDWHRYADSRLKQFYCR